MVSCKTKLCELLFVIFTEYETLTRKNVGICGNCVSFKRKLYIEVSQFHEENLQMRSSLPINLIEKRVNEGTSLIGEKREKLRRGIEKEKENGYI